jgi:hypothetical protein
VAIINNKAQHALPIRQRTPIQTNQIYNKEFSIEASEESDNQNLKKIFYTKVEDKTEKVKYLPVSTKRQVI